jgi:hypothetical protein
MSETKNDITNPVQRIVMPDLWLVWDGYDGETTVVLPEKYIEFCKKFPDRFWGFQVTKVELGIPMSECEEIDIQDIHYQVSDELEA